MSFLESSHLNYLFPMPFPKNAHLPCGVASLRSLHKSMGTPWECLRANYRRETLINRGLICRKARSGAFESLLHRHIYTKKP